MVLPDLAPGSWYLLAAADDGNAVAESNETNNTRFATVLVGPDLAFLSINAPLSAVAGSTISVSDTLRNNGADLAGSSTTRFYLSLNAALDATDILLDASRPVGSLPPNGSSAGTTSVTLPPGIVGAYYIIAVADAAGAVAEAVETNNTSARPITIGK